MNLIDRYQNEKRIALMQDELGCKIAKEFVGLRAKSCSYLKDDNDEDKKSKGSKKCVKRKTKSIQLEYEIKHLGKNQIDIDSIKKVIKNS